MFLFKFRIFQYHPLPNRRLYFVCDTTDVVVLLLLFQVVAVAMAAHLQKWIVDQFEPELS